MYGSPIWTLRAALRAPWVKRRGAVACTIERHMPRGKRTRWPVTSAPAFRKISVASGKLTISMPTCSRSVSAFSSICSRPSVEITSTGASLRVRYGQRVHRPGQALRLASRATASHGRVFEVRSGHSRLLACTRADGRGRGRQSYVAARGWRVGDEGLAARPVK